MFRVGYGVDVHAFANDRRLVIGGITIPYDKGLAGHSDADVLVHAICDALLGAAGLGDIGRWFPDSTPQYKNIDSTVLLSAIVDAVVQRDFTIINIDATVLAQAPRIAPYTDRIRARLAPLLAIEPDRINIKATTTEGLGFCGRAEGIEARAVCLLQCRTEPSTREPSF